MAGIPQNTNYSNPNTKLMPIISAISKVGKSFGPRRLDTSRFQGVTNSMKNYNPVSGSSDQSLIGTITTPFMGSTKYEARHPGIDYSLGGIGSPVSSLAPGVVVKTESGHRQGEKNYGNYVMVVDDQGNTFRYSHLSGNYVKVGDKIGRGTVIGAEGNTGMTYSPSGKGTGAHIDLRIRDMWGKYVDPNRFIK